MEQHQKFEEVDDPLMSEPYQATESFTEEPSSDTQGDEVSSSNATQ